MRLPARTVLSWDRWVGGEACPRLLLPHRDGEGIKPVRRWRTPVPRAIEIVPGNLESTHRKPSSSRQQSCILLGTHPNRRRPRTCASRTHNGHGPKPDLMVGWTKAAERASCRRDTSPARPAANLIPLPLSLFSTANSPARWRSHSRRAPSPVAQLSSCALRASPSALAPRLASVPFR